MTPLKFDYVSGIIVDTRRFSYHTTTNVNGRYFKQKGAKEVSSAIARTRLRIIIVRHLIERAEIFKDEFIIVCSDEMCLKVQIAQTADELLNVQNIKASFVISCIDEQYIELVPVH